MNDQQLEGRMATRLKQFDLRVAEARLLFEERNRGYRDAIRFNGVIGVLYEWAGIAGRLKALRNDLLRVNFLEQADRPDVYANLRDKLMDAIVYGLIALMLLEDGNILGEE